MLIVDYYVLILNLQTSKYTSSNYLEAGNIEGLEWIY